jgi:hypothetical protein
LSKALSTLITSCENAEEFSRKVSYAPVLANEVREIAPAILAAAEPMQPDALYRRVLEIMAAWGIRAKEAGEHREGLVLWNEALAPLPLEAIEAGVLECSRTCKFLPTPAEIYQASLPKFHELKMRAYRIKEAMKRIDAIAAPEKKRMTRAEMIDAGFMDADGRIILTKNTAKAAAPPPVQRSGETPQEMAARLRGAAEEDEAV